MTRRRDGARDLVAEVEQRHLRVMHADLTRRGLVGAVASMAAVASARAQITIVDPNGHEEILRLTPKAGLGGTGVMPVVPEYGHVLVAVRVNGAAAVPFVFDTGSQATVLDLAFADALPLQSAGAVAVQGVKGGRLQAAILKDLQLDLGPISLAGQTALVTTLPNHIVDRGARPRIGGILGCSAFGDRTLRLDVAGRTLAWLADDAEPDSRGIVVRISSGEGDSILAVAGRPARDLSLGDFTRLAAPVSGATEFGFADGRRLALAAVQILP